VQVFADKDYCAGEIKLLPATTTLVFTPPAAEKAKTWEPLDMWLVVAELEDGRKMYAAPSTVMPEKKSETDRTAPKKSARQAVMEPFWCPFFGRSQ
jgi:hypothetical protein